MGENHETPLLTCPENLFVGLTQSDQPAVEHLAYGYCGVSQSEDPVEYLLRDIESLKEKEYVSRTAGLVQSTHELTWRVWERSGQGYACLVSAHSHTGPAFFSTTDDRHDHRVWRNVLDFCPAFIRLVAGTDGCVAQVLSRTDPDWKPLEEIRVIGPGGIRRIRPKNARDKTAGAKIDLDLHDRTLRLGPGARQALESIHHSVFGFHRRRRRQFHCRQFVKFFHPKKMILVDPDRIEGHNANRFLGYRYGDEGSPKGEVLAREIRAYHPDIQVEPIPERFPGCQSYQALKEADVLVSFPDNPCHAIRPGTVCRALPQTGFRRRDPRELRPGDRQASPGASPPGS